jgi:hypothetical protein
MKNKARQAAQAYPGTIELCPLGLFGASVDFEVAPQPPRTKVS